MALFYYYLRSKLFDAIESMRVKKEFYSDANFEKIDRALLSSGDPYSISKQYLHENGDPNLYQYGETPLTTLIHMARAFGIDKEETVVEMGAGSGRAAFALAHFTGCKVVGIERIEPFVKKANQISTQFNLDNITFCHGDMMAYDWKGATTLFLYQSMLEDEKIMQLCNKIDDRRLKVITVSYPLSDYDERFCITQEMEGHFPFGKATIYCNRLLS